jgi:hypothetical protein
MLRPYKMVVVLELCLGALKGRPYKLNFKKWRRVFGG